MVLRVDNVDDCARERSSNYWDDCIVDIFISLVATLGCIEVTTMNC